MADYFFKDAGNAVAYDALSWQPLRKRINIPELIANQAFGQELVDSNGNVLSLPSTGFAAADTLTVFQVPAGFLGLLGGMDVLTAEGAVSTADLGDEDQAAGYLDDVDLNAVGSEITAVADAFGADNVMGKVYDADQNIQILFNSADTETAIFDVFLVGMLVAPAL